MKKEDMAAAIEYGIQHSRIAKGLPRTVEDDTTLRQIAEIIRSATAEQQTRWSDDE